MASAVAACTLGSPFFQVVPSQLVAMLCLTMAVRFINNPDPRDQEPGCISAEERLGLTGRQEMKENHGSY